MTKLTRTATKALELLSEKPLTLAPVEEYLSLFIDGVSYTKPEHIRLILEMNKALIPWRHHYSLGPVVPTNLLPLESILSTSTQLLTKHESGVLYVKLT